MSDETQNLPDQELVDPVRSKLPRPVLITIIGLGVAVLIALVVVIVLLAQRPSSPVAVNTPSASATSSVTPTPTRSATPTPTPTPIVIAAPAPVDPAPADPVAPPADPAPANPPPLPDPPAPVIPLSIDSMSVQPVGACAPGGTVVVHYTATGAISAQNNLRVKSGGMGTAPIFDQNWAQYASPAAISIYIDCSERPIWYFTLTVTNGSQTKQALLTMVNGVDQGWHSSN